MPDPAAFGLNEAFEVYIKHREAILQMWSFFSAGTLAVLGFTLGSDKATLTKAAVRTVQLGYAIFALGNLAALVSSQCDYRAVAKLVRRLAGEQKISELASIETFHPALFAGFHILVTVAVLAAIHYTYKSRGSRTPNPSIERTRPGKPGAAPDVER